ncbi:MAG: family 43 glycosylhydrolase [Oscillospiraceae bacterium]|nr:family 43 glycosylhydrolase [Oscillospiraceae bacterium]
MNVKRIFAAVTALVMTAGLSGITDSSVFAEEEGIFYHYDMEGDVSAFAARGGCRIEASTSNAYKGNSALLVSGRTATWNGAQLQLSTETFVPGSEYSFSACYAQFDADENAEFKMTLQYTMDDGTHYDQIALDTTETGNYVLLSNPDFKIPDGASDLYLVFETTGDTGSFCIDEVIIAKAGTKAEGPSPIRTSSVKGDLDGDEKIGISDLVLLKSGIINSFRSNGEKKNADVDQSREVNAADAQYLQEYLLGKITEFPDNKPALSIDISKFESMFAGTKLANSWKYDGENNPLTTQRFGADPGWLIYKDRLYLYTTNDAFETKSNGVLRENTYDSGTVNCISTTDLVNWTDHGAIPVAGRNGRTVNGPAKWANNAWAPDAAWKTIDGKDKFFLYFANNGSGIGVVTADDPTFKNCKDPIGKELISGRYDNIWWLFDPGVYFDEKTGKGYITFGGGSGSEGVVKTRVAQLGDNMTSIVGTPVPIEAPKVFEDSSLIKINNTWYYSFCHNWQGGGTANGFKYGSADIGYMTSDNPLGPYKYQGVVFPNTGSQRIDAGGNNHHSIIEYKNKFFVAYHARQQVIRMKAAMGLKFYKKNSNEDAGDGNYRSTHLNEATFANGKISAKGDMKGVSQIETLNPYVKVQAETMQNQAGINVRGVGDTVVTETHKGDWIKVAGVKFDKGASVLTARVGSKNGGGIKVCTGKTSEAVAYIDVPAGDLTEVEMPVFGELNGTKDLYFIFTEGVEFDWWQFS